ncbi:uncharacterized protein B0H64DRAFT_472321 [Chaetomium fimeti]|uniref:Protection of telomeres protein 1 n=1 Tax=Chaetomium fimeti TaxID=1854472 RepID=A0AAE0HMC0_9PEZI|nr:hypothetical protein B0H64DRAFT_472321 [Chaetomium fimeti]
MTARDSRKSVGLGGAAPPEPSLPPKFTNIRAILDEDVPVGSFVNVIGVVKDCRLPMPTSRTDYKSTITLYDLSIDDESYGLNLVIFRPEAYMPQVTVGDVILVTSAKVQKYQANPLSLITNHVTSIRVYKASKIPDPPQSAKIALEPAQKGDGHVPNPEETAYVSHIYHKIDKYSLPEETEFQARAVQSLNIKRKFSLLRDVEEGKFYDLVVQVAREPYAGFDLVTLYVSDYTENPHFHPRVWEGLSEPTSGYGDPYGYTTGGGDMPREDWVGPYGKRSLQLTCFEPHSSYIRDEVKAGQWVMLRNVQIKHGKNGQFLEGFMRGERNASSTTINVHVLETRDADTIDPTLKEALRRCRDYQKKKKRQIKEVKSAQAAGLKRKASSSSGQETRLPNGKDRRKALRAVKNQEEDETPNKRGLRPDLNRHITCETHDAPSATIESILQPTVHEVTSKNQATALVLPFICGKSRASARVIDFFPPSLEDFACGRRRTEYDVLSDNEEDSEDPSSSHDEDTSSSQLIWEWRFALHLEDAALPSDAKGSGPRSRLWVLVDNPEAQCLTGLNAADLRQDPDTLNKLRERMFMLWGNLEEVKSLAAERKPTEERTEDGKQRRPGKSQPPLPKPRLQSSPAEDEREGNEETVSNSPFSCCIKQYGVYEGREGEGQWVRCFGLFGTKILV